ncbi:TPA: YbcC family protein [Vibrio cholerae]|uniref:YbcC family protein n=1 Tax=Vibrio cholerae TaxID=666 RepID=UPI00163D2514|nr:YbcC family protein [Vibrio cholerae]HDG1725804.1 YbcC family protein [Vibrio cholerae]
MNAPRSLSALSTTANPALSTLVEQVCALIAPNWPLDRMIAVSPYWKRIDKPFAQAAAELKQLAASPMTMTLSDYHLRWQNQQIQSADLQQAIAEQNSDLSESTLIAALQQPTAPSHPWPLLCDTVDSRRDLEHHPAWNEAITHQISQFCAAYFDHHQADWSPDQQTGLFATWREAMIHDRSITLLLNETSVKQKATKLPEDAMAAIEQTLAQLAIAPAQQETYLQAVLMRISGWASWCAYLAWQAGFEGRHDEHLRDLLAIRLCWENLLDDGERGMGSVWLQWQQSWAPRQSCEEDRPLRIALLWQRSAEIAYQRQLFAALTSVQESAPQSSYPEVQAAFCIDVRSEVIRRHLEAQSPHIQTLGFAGFFGLPIRYQLLGTEASRPQLPGLLAPSLIVSDSTGDEDQDAKLALRRRARLKRHFSWRAFHHLPASTFTLVETTGLAYLTKLLKRTLSYPASSASVERFAFTEHEWQSIKPQFTRDPQTLAQRAQMAANILRALGIATEQARLVLLVGHGSQTQNNPQRAGLDCGACCGQSGEVNARTLAALLNDQAVRRALPEYGISLRDDVYFIAALHNTTTEAMTLFDRHEIPTSHREALEQLDQQLTAASHGARQERAPSLELNHNHQAPQSKDSALSAPQLEQAFLRRAHDWAQTRPEWGLTNNAAFIIAPRQRSKQAKLDGRVFLHEYQPERDPEGQLLTQIMTAPMLVTHWINMQYFASTVDNRRFGSGNKTLHNVVGGNIGLFEGNGGDLRCGLALQSLHDGQGWRHEALRLTVVIDAPRERIEQVMASHRVVEHLVKHEWLYLARFADQGIEIYLQGTWQRITQPSSGCPQSR